MKPIRKYKGDHNKARGYFYEPWLIKELALKQYDLFIPQLYLTEHNETFQLSIKCKEIRKEDCSIEVEFPYLYIRIQQREEREKLFGLLQVQPIMHLFARHFLIPRNVNMENISYSYTPNKLIIYMPKF